MKTVLKLVIAIALLNAVVRGADSAWNYYQLKDAAQRALLFGSQASSKQIHEQIMERAIELRVPLSPENLTVSWRTGRRIAEASYTQQIEFFPKYHLSNPVLVQRRHGVGRVPRPTMSPTRRFESSSKRSLRPPHSRHPGADVLPSRRRHSWHP